MRPSASLSDAQQPRSRKHSLADQTAFSNDKPTNVPISFFVRRGSDFDQDDEALRPTKREKISPVETLQETVSKATPDSSSSLALDNIRDTLNFSRRRSTIKAPDSSRHSSSRNSVSVSLGNDEHSPVPIIASSEEPSLPSSPKSISSPSLRKSDDESASDDNSSQAIVSSEEEEAGLPSAIQDSAPQLIMPSIKMPSRRPFTDRGKTLGRYKILVTGNVGSGKTSLMKSIVQVCEDIVHVDPLNANPSELHSRTNPSTPASKQPPTEIYASTKPYPVWWSDVDESRVLRRRKSMGDFVLERNICFVEVNTSSQTEGAIHYIERQLLNAISSITCASSDLTGLLSGRGGGHVDIILYLITKDTFQADCERIKLLSEIANVVPLLAKADLLSAQDIAELKSLGAHLPSSLSKLPAFPSQPLEPASEEQNLISPYTISAATGSDMENMDASLLMASEYVQPLSTSELVPLVEQLFDLNVVAYLRHTAAKKLINWHATHPALQRTPSPSAPSPHPSALASPLQTSLSNSGVLVPFGSDLSLTTSNSYALAKVADHSQREERLAQMRLSKWASDLQTSLQRERERYEKLARSERAVWLIEKMGEQIQDGQVLPIIENKQALTRKDERSPTPRSGTGLYAVHDPLGLLRWHDSMRTKGWIAFQIIGSFGVIGGLALWLVKTTGFTATLHTWAQEWGLLGERC